MQDDGIDDPRHHISGRTQAPLNDDEMNALPPGTRFGALELLRTLGLGGFGIVYLAQDHALDRQVAIKEYMPGQLARRIQGSQVSVRSGSYQETFELGRRSFVNEARLLARFDHRSILKVYQFWEANGTAYMAMPFLQGQTLRQVRQAMKSAPDQSWLLRVLLPVMDGLAVLHAEQVYHRDIAPDNILLPDDGSDPILLDFGAARRVISDRTQAVTAILKPSYAPIEQYAESAGLRQGPWTDIYALGAVMLYLLSGRTPPPATARAIHDDYRPLRDQALPGFSPALLAAVDWALCVRPMDRPQSMAQLRAALLGEITAPPLPAPAQHTVIDAAAPGAAADIAIDLDQTRAQTAVYERTQQQVPPPPVMPEPAPAPAPATAAQPSVRPAPPTPPAPAPSSVSAPSPFAPGAEPSRHRGMPALLASVGLLATASAGLLWWWLAAGTAPVPSAVPSAAVAASAAASTTLAAVVPAPPSAPASAAPLPASAMASAPAAVAPAQTAAQIAALGAAAQPRRQPAAPTTQAAAARDSVDEGSGFDPLVKRRPDAVVLNAEERRQRPLRRNAGEAGAGTQPSTGSGAKPAAESARPTSPGSTAQGLNAEPASRPAATRKTQAAQAAGQATGQATTGPQDPRAACGRRVFLAMALCIARHCEQPAYAGHAECKSVQSERERNGGYER